METLLDTPARLARASLTRGRSRRKGPILSPFLREIHLALTLVSIFILGGGGWGGRYVIFNSPNRDAPSHLPPPPPPPSTQPPSLAAPRRTSSVSAAGPSPSWLCALDVSPRARSCPPPPQGTPSRCGSPSPAGGYRGGQGQGQAGTALLRLPHGEVETPAGTRVEGQHLLRHITPFHGPPST